MATVTVGELEIPAEVTSLEGFRAWAASLGDTGPLVCFAGGDVFVEVSPQHLGTHALVLTAVNATLAALAAELELGHYFMPPTLVTCAEAGLSTEPDGFLARYASFETGLIRVHEQREHELVGRPDLALEVVSKTSRKKDTQLLRARYAQAGVPEYWLIDAQADPVDFQLLVLEAGAYRAQPRDADAWRDSPCFGRAFRLLRGPGRVGLPSYRLEVR